MLFLIRTTTEKKCLVQIFRGVRLFCGIYSVCVMQKNCSVTVPRRLTARIFTVGDYIHSWGQRSGQLIDKTKGEYGDIVLFDWNGDGISDHVGLILSRNSNGTYETVEGNTASYNYSNGGYVLKMTRYYSSILAIIRPKYESEENGGDTVKTTEKKFVIDVSEHQGVIDWNKVKSKIELSAAVTEMILRLRTISSMFVTFPSVNVLKYRKVFISTATQRQKLRLSRSLLIFFD